jgi:hypothetical protein
MSVSGNIRFLDSLAVTTEGFEPDVKWTPFYDLSDSRVGYKIEPLNGDPVQYIYFNVSGSGDRGKADTFVYQGEANDAAADVPSHFYTPLDEGEGDSIRELRAQVKEALEGDSNDSEHDALVACADWFGVDYESPDAFRSDLDSIGGV